jgi:hypothetical protein
VVVVVVVVVVVEVTMVVVTVVDSKVEGDVLISAGFVFIVSLATDCNFVVADDSDAVLLISISLDCFCVSAISIVVPAVQSTVG